jgi:hypothetical protein
MIAKIEIERDQLRRILRSLHQSGLVSDDDGLDVNLTVSPNDSVKIYIRSMGFVQVMHELTDSDGILVEVEQGSRFVFFSKVLRSVVQKARPGPLTIKFYHNKYTVQLSNDKIFSTPTSLDLRLVTHSEFTESRELDNLVRVVDIEREPLKESLETMDIVSNILQFKINQGEFWISVSDKVEGEGKVMTYTGPECDLVNWIQKYQAEPIIRFLDNLTTESVRILVDNSGTLAIEAEREGLVSSLYQSPRVAGPESRT